MQESSVQMGGYRLNSVQIPFVPLRPLIIDFEVTIPVPGALAGRIVFDRDMDTSVLPTVETFTLSSDGVPLLMTPIVWTGTRRLDCNTTGNPPVVSGYVRQDLFDPLCFSSLGTYARPQSDVQWFP